jgi:hypothetical protein
VRRINGIAEIYEREARDLVWSECRTTGDRALSSTLSGLRPQDRESSAAAEHMCSFFRFLFKAEKYAAFGTLN